MNAILNQPLPKPQRSQLENTVKAAREVAEKGAREGEKGDRQAGKGRPPRGHGALIGRGAKGLELRRQELFLQLGDGGLQDVIKTLADLGDESERMAIWKDYHATMEGAEVTGNE